MRAVYAGSFSPPTLGHLDIIRRASTMFDEVVVAVMSQTAKTYVFSPQARLEMLREVTAEFANVRVIADQGLLADLVRREGADVILRGLRGEGRGGAHQVDEYITVTELECGVKIFTLSLLGIAEAQS